MRTKNSIRNIIVSCLSYGIIFIGSFVSRKVFASILGLEIVGIDGAFTNVVSALAIVEMGLGVGIVYKLYSPIAQEDWDQVSCILCFLRRCYLIISCVVLSLGLLTAYFVVQPIKEDFSKIWLIRIFILYVLDVIASYLFAHKRSMFIADQKNYVNNLIHIIVQVFMFTFQIAVLKFFASFELFLICKIVCRVVENLLISYRFDRNYKFLDLKSKVSLPDIEKKDLFKNIKAMLFHKISAFGTSGVSSLIIVYGASLKENGVYNNYMLIVMAVTTITNEVFNGILASFGNLLSTSESREKVYRSFNVLYFVNFLIYSFIISCFVCLITPFIELWTGKGSAFDLWTTLAITGYLYNYGMRQSIGMAKIGAGIYDPDKYLSIVGALITLVSSFLLVGSLGVAGVMLGNIIGLLSIPQWIQPYLVYRTVFHKEVKSYHVKFGYYTLLTAVYTYLSYSLCNSWGVLQGLKWQLGQFLEHFRIPLESSMLISQICVNLLVCLVIPNLINVVLFYRTKEFKELLSVAKSLLLKHKKSSAGRE